MANTSLMRDVLAYLQDNPRDFDSQRWHKDFAGWSLRLSGAQIVIDDDAGELLVHDGKALWICDIERLAREVLEITGEQGDRLFVGGNTIQDLEEIVGGILADEPTVTLEKVSA